MRRYFIGFVIAYVLSTALCVGMALLAICNWLFGGTPLWFGVLFVIVILLPYLAVGDLAGRKKTADKAARRKALFILLAVALGGGIVNSFFIGGDMLQVFLMPGSLLGLMVDGEILPILSNLLLPLLYHLGYYWGANP